MSACSQEQTFAILKTKQKETRRSGVPNTTDGLSSGLYDRKRPSRLCAGSPNNLFYVRRRQEPAKTSAVVTKIVIITDA